MKIIPPDPLPDPEPPARTPRATTTRFLRLRPAPDVAPAAPHPPTGTRSLPRPGPAEAADPVPTPLPPARAPAPISAPLPSFAKPAPVASSAPVTAPPASTPLPTFPISPAPAAGSQRLPLPAAPSSAPEDQPDDRPMRLTTKRLPNIFASAPSARWSTPSNPATRPLRLISPAAIAGSSESLITPPAAAETAASPVIQPQAETASDIAEPEEIPPQETLPDEDEFSPVMGEEAPPEAPPPTALGGGEPASQEAILQEAFPREPAPATNLPEKIQPELLPVEEPAVEPFITAPESELPAPPVSRAVEPITFAPRPASFTPAVVPSTRSGAAAPPGFTPTHKLTPPPVPLSRLAKDESKRSSLGPGFWILLLVLCVLLIVLLYLFGLTPRIVAGRELDHEQKLSTQRIVDYGVAHLATPHVELPLPGTIEASQQAALYARTSGYVKKWLVDIGDHVVAGQLLAELDTPDVDQQLAQAKAAADQAHEELNITESVAHRWDTMADARAVAKEDADQKDAANAEAKAAYTAAQANLARLTDLENFKEIRAPFTGKITYRNIDVGSLVSAGSGTPNSELFRVAQTDPVRVDVEVPESNAPAIKAGVPADIQVSSYPGRVFHGKVMRDAGALSDSTRTLHTEIRVPNPDGALLPGAFADVRLQLFDSAPAVLIPANALIVNASGTSVALLQDHYGHDIVHYTPVRVGRDFGTEVEILENVHQGDRLVTNPPTDLTDGTAVISKPSETPPAPAVPPPSSPSPTRA